MELLRRKRDQSTAVSDPAAPPANPKPATQQAPPVQTRGKKTLKWIGLVLLAVLVVGIAVAVLPLVSKWWHPKKETEDTVKIDPAVKLVAAQPPTVELQPATI